MKTYNAIVIGGSSGGVQAVSSILSKLPKDFKPPIFIVQHISPDSSGFIVKFLSSKTNILVKEAEDKENIQLGVIYVAPANYHLLIESDKSISLSVDEKENYSRPNSKW